MSKAENTPAIKLTFGEPPKTFEKEVHTKLLNGTNLTFRMTFIYRNREEYGAWMDALSEGLKNSAQNESGENESGENEVTIQKVFKEKAVKDAEAVLDMAKGWSLSDPFTLEHLTFMAVNYPGVIYDISETYRAAVLEGRTKN